MSVPQLLLDTLENLGNNDFNKFKWFLSEKILDDCSPIPKSRLEAASHTETVSRMKERYGEERAVNITLEILKKMGLNGSAVELNAYKGKTTAKPSTTSSAVAPGAEAPPAAPGMISAHQGAVVFAPNISNCTAGSWNINIK